MRYKDPITGDYKELHFKTGDTLPVGTIVEYDGDEVPPGYKEIPGVVASVVISPTEPETGEEVWIQKGKNLIEDAYFKESYSISGDTGLETLVHTNGCGTNYIKVEPDTYYTLSANKSINNLRLSEYKDNKEHIQRTAKENVTSITIKTTPTTKYLRWSLNYDNATTVTLDILKSIDLQLEQGEAATTYEPYIPKKIFVRNDNGVYEEFYNEENLEVYSTSEQRIGTWFGKPLYRKVIEFTMAFEEGNNYIPHGISKLDKVIRKDLVNNSASMFPYLDTNETASIFQVTGEEVNIKCIGGSWGSSKRWIILEYTKD